MTALATFLATAKRIEGLLASLDGVRRHPDRVMDDVKQVTIYANSARWNYQTVPKAATSAAEEIRDQVAAQFRANAEAERDARLTEIAAELNALRAVLPQQAAAVAIELGHTARILQHEAQGGTP